MQWIIFIPVVATAAAIFLQDFRSRSVHAILFVLLAVLGAAMQLQHVPLKEFMVNSAVNVVMLLVQLGITIGVVRRKKMIGAGDLVFLAACCVLFSPFAFLFFLITSFSASLLLHAAFMRNSLYVKSGSTVALAGWQSLVLIIFICTTVISGIELYADEWILKFLV